MSEAPLNREELLQDSQATLRKVAGVLDEFWGLQAFEPQGSSCPDVTNPFARQREDIRKVLANTHREVQALQEGIGALHRLLPNSITRGSRRKVGDPESGTARGARATRASEILSEIQTRLDRLAHDIWDEGSRME